MTLGRSIRLAQTTTERTGVKFDSFTSPALPKFNLDPVTDSCNAPAPLYTHVRCDSVDFATRNTRVLVQLRAGKRWNGKFEKTMNRE